MNDENLYTDWDNMPLLLTVEQAARLLHVHYNTIRRLIARRAFPARKVGREWRIAKADLRAWLDAGKQE